MAASLEQRMISSEGAERCLEVARREAETLGIPMSIAVVDAAGVLKAFHRMDGARIMSAASSQKKAFTAATTQFATKDYFDAFRDGPEVVLLALMPGATGFGGGHPIVEDGAVIGAIGVGGGSVEQDAAIAATAAAAIAG